MADIERGRAVGEELVSHAPAIRRYILGIVRDPAVADDLTQETLLRAHAALSRLTDPERLVPWLYRIATNICRDRFRSASYRHRPRSLETLDGQSVPEPVDAGPRLDKLLEQEEMSDCVQGFIGGLPDAYRAVILLHDTEGLTGPEIAEMLGISLANVKIRLHRARARLREALGKACAFRTDERGVLVCDSRPPAAPRPVSASDRAVPRTSSSRPRGCRVRDS